MEREDVKSILESLLFVADGPLTVRDGRPVTLGEWRARSDGYWELVIPLPRA